MIQKRQVEFAKPDENLSAQQLRDNLMNKLVQYSMNFANDSFQTSLCIQYPSYQVAQSCVFLGGQFAKAKADWTTVQKIADVESFASICVQLIALVSEKKGGDKAAYQTMRLELEKLRRANSKMPSKKSPPRSPHPPPPDAKRPRSS